MNLPCPVQAECGGCGLMPLRLQEQHELKLEYLRKALEQNGVATPGILLTPSHDHSAIGIVSGSGSTLRV